MASLNPSTTQGNVLKRKRPAQQDPEPSRKKGRVAQRQIARVIASQTSGTAFGDGEINVDKFVGAQQFAIKALEDGMKSSKKTLSTRAFQNVPRELRRRTASHNVKKVPKRLRARAAKEMKEDNTPTVTAKTRKKTGHMRLRLDTAKRLKDLGTKKKTPKNAEKGSTEADLMSIDGASKPPKTAKTGTVVTREPRIKKNTMQKPSKPKARFRKRQIHKAWLPTHLFHAKRARMTPPKEPLWRMAIPLSPTAKCYRPSHRAATLRGGIAWDMSYISTIGLEGPDKSIIGLLKALGIGKDESSNFWEGKGAARWMSGGRAWDGWAYERESWPLKAIAPITIFWCANAKNGDTDAMDVDKPHKVKRRLFIRVHPSAFLQLWEEILRLSKVQKPAVVVEDLRYEIGSIEVVGPGSTEALVNILQPVKASRGNNEAEEFWHLLADVTNPGSLPANAVVAMNVADPRLNQLQKSMMSKPGQSTQQQEQLLRILSAWPLDKSPAVADIFERTHRIAAYCRLPSKKAVDRRRTLAEPGQNPKHAPNDPEIPVLLLASRNQNGGQGSWTLLLPWKCVLPIWYAMMHCPLSTGGTLRYGGLDQKRQIAFETDTPWFPADYPGTKAGMDWEVQQRIIRKKEWESRPKGKRIEFDSLNLRPDSKGEVGLGWGCDWEKLVEKRSNGESRVYHMPSVLGISRINSAASAETISGDTEALLAVRIILVGRGVPTTCARIYRLPMDDHERHQKWLALRPTRQSEQKLRTTSASSQEVPSYLARRRLAASLLGIPEEKESDHPDIPGEHHLIGFITTGNYNLGEGKGTGLGSISLGKALEYKKWKAASSRDQSEQRPGGKLADEHLCIVREAGQTIGRLAKWEVV